MARILVADDEPRLGKLVAETIEGDGNAVTRVSGGKQALIEIAAKGFDVVVTDLRMPEVDGMAVLREVRRAQPQAQVLVMTAFGTTESAVEAMRAGAADYLLKPFALDELRLRVRKLAELSSAREQSQRLVEQLTPGLVAESPGMREVLNRARQVAGTDATVLLLGESGTGKSQLARFIHYGSARAKAPLVEVHCAALTETLLESELFGHEKGAFTGTNERKVGHLEAAERGTLFLDEIGEVTPATQVKLLRFLQERQFVPVGSVVAQKADVRVVAATNRDLEQAVQDRTFREDLYYRLNVFSLEVPPLRQRREDILPIAEGFLARRGLPKEKLSEEVRSALLSYSWPGNIRELENGLERALILAGEGPMTCDHFRFGRARASVTSTGIGDLLQEGFSLDSFEREIIHEALERAAGNKTAAAKLLGITRRRLYSRLEILERDKEPSP